MDLGALIGLPNTILVGLEDIIIPVVGVTAVTGVLAISAGTVHYKNTRHGRPYSREIDGEPYSVEATVLKKVFDANATHIDYHGRHPDMRGRNPDENVRAPEAGVICEGPKGHEEIRVVGWKPIHFRMYEQLRPGDKIMIECRDKFRETGIDYPFRSEETNRSKIGTEYTFMKS